MKMQKKIIILFALFYFITPSIALPASLNVSAKSAILIDATTGRIFFDKKSTQRCHPASLTKIMTGIIAIELARPQELVTVSKKAAEVSVGSTIDLHQGDKISLENLLKAALIASANDSTVAIAEHIAGNHDLFVEMMNLKAGLLGAINTHFVNTNGYSKPNHYSTAQDLALLARYSMRNSYFAELVATKEAVIKWSGQDREMKVRNTNRLLRSELEGVDGIKTGSTPKAGSCLIASATRGDRQLFAVVLRSGNRYLDATRMLEYGFEKIKSSCKTTMGDHQ